MGHPEYDRYTLDEEYKRDLQKGMDIAMPENYYPDNDINAKPLLQWRSHGNMLYANWLNYYVYQQTPYDYINTRKLWENKQISFEKGLRKYRGHNENGEKRCRGTT